MDNRKKENAVRDFLQNIVNSWTWKKLTEREKKEITERIQLAEERHIISGTYAQREKLALEMYDIYMMGQTSAAPERWRP